MKGHAGEGVPTLPITRESDRPMLHGGVIHLGRRLTAVPGRTAVTAVGLDGLVRMLVSVLVALGLRGSCAHRPVAGRLGGASEVYTSVVASSGTEAVSYTARSATPLGEFSSASEFIA